MGLVITAYVSAETDDDGAATVYSQAFNGRLTSVRYVKDATSPFADTVDFMITNETTGELIWEQANVSASDHIFPKRPNDGTDGTQLTGQYDPVFLANETIKVEITNGGATKVGVFWFTVER